MFLWQRDSRAKREKSHIASDEMRTDESDVPPAAAIETHAPNAEYVGHT